MLHPPRSVRPFLTALACALTLVVTLALAGCGLARNTLAQDLASERWERCRSVSNMVQLKEIRPDGQMWLLYEDAASGELNRVQDCLRTAATEQAQRRVAVAPPTSAMEAPPAASTGLPAPRWNRGDEWAFRWESPSGKGTFVWSVDREEALDGADFYVIKTGRREMYYRKSDLALYVDRVDGDPETRNTPPLSLAVWPLKPGRTWEQTYTRERPKERTTEEITLNCAVADKEEAVAVPAGTFSTLRITCRNKKTGRPNFEIWYAPVTKFIVKDRTEQSYGIRERELIQYRLR